MQTKLIILRKETKTTQKELADLLGITKASYISKEHGKNEFKITEMFKIAQYFNKKIDDVFVPYILQNGVK